MAKTAAADFDDIAGKARGCRLCAAHLPLGPRPVFQIDSKARILIAGQAPGRRVHATGIPFDDPSGERLRSWMGIDAAVFYDPRKVAILPMGFCYPGSGKSGDLPPRPECAAEWRARLLNLLPAVELTLVIGQYALDWHLKTTQKKSLTETVQNWKQYWPALLPLAEIQAGISQLERKGSSRRAAALAHWLDAILELYNSRILSFTASTALEAGRLLDRAIGAGAAPGSEDAAIAATAAIHNLIIVTANTRHFQYFGVPLISPYE